MGWHGERDTMQISSAHVHASFSHQTLISEQNFEHKIENFKITIIEH